MVRSPHGLIVSERWATGSVREERVTARSRGDCNFWWSQPATRGAVVGPSALSSLPGGDDKGGRRQRARRLRDNNNVLLVYGGVWPRWLPVGPDVQGISRDEGKVRLNRGSWPGPPPGRGSGLSRPLGLEASRQNRERRDPMNWHGPLPGARPERRHGHDACSRARHRLLRLREESYGRGSASRVTRGPGMAMTD